jgi:hypothetical protein
MIKTVYYSGVSKLSNVVKTTASVYAFNAVPNAVRHLQTNEYGATLCEVYDENNGTLHAVMKRNVKGEIHILFKREVMAGE